MREMSAAVSQQQLQAVYCMCSGGMGVARDVGLLSRPS